MVTPMYNCHTLLLENVLLSRLLKTKFIRVNDGTIIQTSKLIIKWHKTVQEAQQQAKKMITTNT